MAPTKKKVKITAIPPKFRVVESTPSVRDSSDLEEEVDDAGSSESFSPPSGSTLPLVRSGPSLLARSPAVDDVPEAPVARRAVQGEDDETPRQYTERSDAALYTRIATENNTVRYTMHTGGTKADSRVSEQARFRETAPVLGQRRIQRLAEASAFESPGEISRVQPLEQSQLDRRYDLYQESTGIQGTQQAKKHRR